MGGWFRFEVDTAVGNLDAAVLVQVQGAIVVPSVEAAVDLGAAVVAATCSTMVERVDTVVVVEVADGHSPAFDLHLLIRLRRTVSGRVHEKAGLDMGHVVGTMVDQDTDFAYVALLIGDLLCIDHVHHHLRLSLFDFGSFR